jgi:hypothetical protein
MVGLPSFIKFYLRRNTVAHKLMRRKKTSQVPGTWAASDVI